MLYGMPRNFRAPRAREDNRQTAKGFKRHQKGTKKFGLALTCNCRWIKGTHHQWYQTEGGRDDAYKRLKKQTIWFSQKLYYTKIRKITR